MMSKKCKYALKALLHFARKTGQGNLHTADIAQAENIPKKFLELILLDLKKGGYVASKQGSGGGYYLVKDPRQITLAEIYRLFDGAIALLPCVSLNFYEKCADCRDEGACPLRITFLAIREQTLAIMAAKTIQSMLENEA